MELLLLVDFEQIFYIMVGRCDSYDLTKTSYLDIAEGTVSYFRLFFNFQVVLI